MKTTKLNRAALSVALILFILGALSFSSRSDAQKTPATPTLDLDWQAKVDATVLSKAALGQTDFLIYMHQQADLSGARSLATKNEKGQYVYQRLTETANATQGTVKLTLQQFGSEYKSFWISNTIYATGGLAVLQAVASLPEVRAIYGPGKGALTLPPNDTTGSAEATQSDSSSSANMALADPNPEPGLLRVNAHDVWAMGFEGQGVVVAGADTGVRWTHTALKNQYRGWNGATASHDYNWKDGIHTGTWPADPANICNGGGTPGNPSPEPCDDDELLGGGHGTHTVGSMAGDDGGTNRIGMAPQAEWMACRNMSRGVGAIPSYLECMEWFIAPTKVDGTSPDPTKAPHVVNNSWGCVEGCPPEPNPLRDTLQASRDAGIVYVASAGNDGDAAHGVGPHVLVCNSVYHPLARYPEAFTIGSTTHTTDLASRFSSRGPAAADPENPTSPLYLKPNVAAPGSNIRSALRGSDTTYGNLSGTSMAGPHAAGLVALVISANPRLAGKVNRIEDIIEQTAVKKTTTDACGGDTSTQIPNNTYGHGRIYALAAVIEALPPVAVDDTATTPQDTPVRIDVVANDTDADEDDLFVQQVSDPAHGSAMVEEWHTDPQVIYTPDPGFIGQDTFTYTMCEQGLCDTTSDTATVTVTVTASGVINYALNLNGGVATASSSHHSGLFPVALAINGDRTGSGWGTGSGGWNDGTRGLYPDDLEVAFNTAKAISEIRVFTLQNGWNNNPGEPTETTLCTAEGILDFEVQTWNGSAWVTVTGGSVTGNVLAMRTFTFPVVTTTKIRVHVTNARNNWTRIVEAEAFGAAGQ
jgi:serine protease AprX